MDAGRTNKQQTLKIELLSQWMIEAEFRKRSINRVLPFGLGLPAYPAVPKMDSRHPSTKVVVKLYAGGSRRTLFSQNLVSRNFTLCFHPICC